MSHILDVLEEMEQIFLEHLEDHYVKVESSLIGLDNRCGYVYIGKDLDDHRNIIAPQGSRIDYYGGFEYIDEEFRRSAPGFTVYLEGDNRVGECIDFYINRSRENTDEE